MSGSRLCEGDPDELVECPLDPAHLLMRKRMPYHIIKCSKNFKQGEFRVCPFNSRHVVPKKELESHLRVCQDRGIVEREMLYTQKAGENDSVPVQKGYTGIPISTFVCEAEESWDDSNVVVDIAPQGGLFLGTGNTLSEACATPPQVKPLAGSREPPKPRVPTLSGGNGSEVFKLATTQINKSPPAAKSIGRGRGRGFLTSPGPGMGTGHGMGAGIGGPINQLQDVAPRGVEPIGSHPLQDVGVGPISLGRGRGRGVKFLVHEAPQLKAEALHAHEERLREEERVMEERLAQELRSAERRKQEKKLKKMLRQIMELEEKQGGAAGEALNQDQLNKIARKNDVLSKLEQFHF